LPPNLALRRGSANTILQLGHCACAQSLGAFFNTFIGVIRFLSAPKIPGDRRGKHHDRDMLRWARQLNRASEIYFSWGYHTFDYRPREAETIRRNESLCQTGKTSSVFTTKNNRLKCRVESTNTHRKIEDQLPFDLNVLFTQPNDLVPLFIVNKRPSGDRKVVHILADP
jgi:hypothetical protein